MKSLSRSSDAILSYSEESGSPVFSIASSLILTNITVNSGATGKVRQMATALQPLLTDERVPRL